MDLKNGLSDLRKDRGISARFAARKIGVSYPTLLAWENSTNKPVIDKTELLANLYGVPMEAIAQAIKQPSKYQPREKPMGYAPPSTSP